MKDLFVKLFEKIKYLRLYFIEQKKTFKKRNLYKNIKLSQEEKEKIDKIFKEGYGKKFSYKWHRLYQSYTGVFDEYYFPEILFSTKLEFKLNPKRICKVLADKALLDVLYSDIDGLVFPEYYLLNCSGIFYDSKKHIISKDAAIKLCQNIGPIVAKTTLGSSSGKSIKIFNIKNGMDKKTGLQVEEIFDLYSANFILQEKIENCENLKNLYPLSINTIRIITYVIDGKLYHCPLSLRVGRNGSFVDNAHAGGLVIGMNEEGFLRKYAFTEMGEKFSKHPDTNVIFENYSIPLIKEMIEIAYKCHERTPHLKIISWDFTIDSNNNICLIEANMNAQTIWFPQYANGCSAFGNNTQYMLNLISKK